MKRLISSEDITRASLTNKEITVDKNTIITDYAKDQAKNLGVEIVELNETIQKKTPATREDKHNQPALSPEEAYTMAKIALQTGAMTEEDLEKLLK